MKYDSRTRVYCSASLRMSPLSCTKKLEKPSRVSLTVHFGPVDFSIKLHSPGSVSLLVLLQQLWPSCRMFAPELSTRRGGCVGESALVSC